MSKHKGWWYSCVNCNWKGIRYPNVQKCPKCHWRALTKLQQATKEEQDADFQEVLRKFKEIPE